MRFTRTKFLSLLSLPAIVFQMAMAQAEEPEQRITNHGHIAQQRPIGQDYLASTPTLDTMQANTGNATPSSVDEAFEALSRIYQQESKITIFDTIHKLFSSGLVSLGIDDIHDYISGLQNGEASESNNNPREPLTPIFPKVKPDDAPYSIPEVKLRAALHIPESFQYGAPAAKQPVLLVGGTGNSGYVTFAGSYIPLLQNEETSFGDPVWLNIPGYSLDDLQTNAEYVAYAIHYLWSICDGRRPIAVLGYSQGNLDAQWAYKHWPSTRARVSDHVAFSPGYHGTQLIEFLAGVPLPPAWRQSMYHSDLVAALLADGGDSAYVPTTVVYSLTDQIVQPQDGEGASSPLGDGRGVGVSNTAVQRACWGKTAGGFYTHEGVMVNPLAYALAKDALEHDGPGQVSRLDLDAVCGSYLAPTLGMEHLILTGNTIVVSAAVTLKYHGKSWTEPAIRE